MSRQQRKQPGPNLHKISPITQAIPAACSDEKTAVEFLEAQLWGDTRACIHCGSDNVYQMRNRKTGERGPRFLWRCREKPCGRQYSVRVKTVFEDSKIPL